MFIIYIYIHTIHLNFMLTIHIYILHYISENELHNNKYFMYNDLYYKILS